MDRSNSPPDVEVWVERVQSSGRYVAALRIHGGLIPAVPIEANTAHEARAALDAALNCQLAKRLIRRGMPDTWQTRAIAARCLDEVTRRSGARTVTHAKIIALARHVSTPAHELLKVLKNADFDALWQLIPGAVPTLLDALKELANPRQQLATLGIDPTIALGRHARGPKERGSRGAWLLRVLDESYALVHGKGPRNDKRFHRAVCEMLAHHGEAVPADLKSWIKRERRKRERSLIAY